MSLLTGGEWDGAIRAAEGLILALASGDVFGAIVSGVALVVSVFTSANNELNRRAIESTRRAADEALRIVRELQSALSSALSDQRAILSAVADFRLSGVNAEFQSAERAARDFRDADLAAFTGAENQKLRIANQLDRSRLDALNDRHRAELDAAASAGRAQIDSLRAVQRVRQQAQQAASREQLRLFRETQNQQLDIARDVARRQTEDATNLYGDQLEALRELYDADLIDLEEFQGRRGGFADTRDDSAREAREALATVEAMLAQEQADFERRLNAESAALSRSASSALASLNNRLASEQAILEEAQALELAELEEQIAMEREARELESEERIAAERLRLQMEYEQAVADAALAAAERSIMIIQNLGAAGDHHPTTGIAPRVLHPPAVRSLQPCCAGAAGRARGRHHPRPGERDRKRGAPDADGGDTGRTRNPAERGCPHRGTSSTTSAR